MPPQTAHGSAVGGGGDSWRCWDATAVQQETHLLHEAVAARPVVSYATVAYYFAHLHAQRRRFEVDALLFFVVLQTQHTASDHCPVVRRADLWPAASRPAPQANCEDLYERRRGRGWVQRRISAVPGWAYLHAAGAMSLAACWPGMGLGCVPMCPMSQLESRTHYRRPSSCSWA